MNPANIKRPASSALMNLLASNKYDNTPKSASPKPPMAKQSFPVGTNSTTPTALGVPSDKHITRPKPIATSPAIQPMQKPGQPTINQKPLWDKKGKN